jgi:DUF2934 family protein
MRHKTASDSTAKPEQDSLELTEIIRARAYQLYEERGCEDGHDLDDWLQAEAEIVGKKPAAAAGAEELEGGSRAAVA